VDRANRFFLPLLGLLLSASASAGFCKAEPLPAPFGSTVHLPEVMAGKPREVQWAAQVALIGPEQSAGTRLLWSASDYLKEGLLWKTVIFQDGLKGSQLYNYADGRWTGGSMRITSLPINQQLELSDSPKALRTALETLDAEHARASLGDPIKISFDERGRPLRYEGGLMWASIDNGYLTPVRMTCEYPSVGQVVERMEVQDPTSETTLFTKVKTYSLDGQGRVAAYESQVRSTDGAVRPVETMSYDYDSIAPRVKITGKGPGGETRMEGTLDARGRPLSLTHPGETTPYITWTYDAKGNWVEYRIKDERGVFTVKRVITY
jgi:YD repeat-containing protein